MKRSWLVLLTIMIGLLAIGLLVVVLRFIYFSNKCLVNDRIYAAGEIFEIEENGKVKSCSCGANGQVNCTDKTEFDSRLTIPIASDQFSRENLTFKSSYLTDSVPSSLSASPLGVQFKSVSLSGQLITIVLEQEQLCTDKNDVPTQAGFYNYSENRLVLYTLINQLSDVYNNDCVVQITYQIDKVVVDATSDFALQVQSDNGELARASTCLYSGRVYNDGDAYQAIDGCNVCRCSSGKTVCGDDKSCDKNGNKTSVYWNNPNYSRYETPEADGECSTDEQCFVGGCSKEVCSATQDVQTSCEAITKIESASCKCASSKCLWVR